MNQLSLPPSREIVLALVAATGDRAGVRFLEFFVAQIRYPRTRRAEHGILHPERCRYGTRDLALKENLYSKRIALRCFFKPSSICLLPAIVLS